MAINFGNILQETGSQDKKLEFVGGGEGMQESVYKPRRYYQLTLDSETLEKPLFVVEYASSPALAIYSVVQKVLALGILDIAKVEMIGILPKNHKYNGLQRDRLKLFSHLQTYIKKNSEEDKRKEAEDVCLKNFLELLKLEKLHSGTDGKTPELGRYGLEVEQE